ncbi:MAG: PD40 domain-containing protein [Deltaproteobacteria bacterium]|nr:PD40 domain-containing protein [Deltaproteobacteria bacterium]
MRAVFLSLALAVGSPAMGQVQDSHGTWRTVETTHYRMLYPIEAEPWALHTAAQLEPIRARVSEEVGYEPEQVVTLVVLDPFRQANGFAIPFTRKPRMGVFATPPRASSAMGYYRSWAEELVVHEDAHLVHLLRPSRNPGLRAFTSGLFGVTPVSMNSPAWVIEGYATMIEGRLTGMGRPNSDFRALLLRRWAQEGRLPTYGQLDGSDRWLSGSVRYLVGSAFLGWLEDRSGDPEALTKLWRRMTARTIRSFDQAFEGVFGDDAASLYGRFTAEVTHAALEIEADRPHDTGTLWMDVGWFTGTPALSPDGSKIALVVTHPHRPSKLVVYATADDPEREQAWRDKIAEMLELDPEDVAPVEPEVFPREPLHVRLRDSRPPHAPRWMPDGSALLFASWTSNAGGWWRPDLYAWNPDSGEERRVTHGADLVAADPHPEGTWAVAVRTSWGAQQLVRVDLSTGEWTPLTEPDPTVVFDSPRFHPDGRRFVYLRHRGGWDVVVRDVKSGAEATLPLPSDTMVSEPAWSADGSEIIVSLGQGGFLELVALPLDGGPPRPITHSPGGATAPAPTPDGEAVFYLSMDSEGLDVHRISLDDALPPSPAPTSTLPVVRPPPPQPVAPPVPMPVTSRPYGLGRQEFAPLLGGSGGPAGASLELGFRLGDPVGRSTLLVLGGLGLEGIEGAAAAWSYRGLPVALTLHGFAVHEDLAEPLTRGGGALALDSRHHWNQGGATWTVGGFVDVPLGEDPTGTRAVAFAGGDLAHRLRRGVAGAGVDIGLRGQGGTTTNAGAWTRGDGRAEVRVGLGPLSLGGTWAAGQTTGTTDLDRYRLGGSDSSLLPEAWLWSRILVPAVAPGSARGQAHDTLRADLGGPGIGVFVERHRVWEACEGLARCGDTGATSLAGVALDVALPPTPLGKLPGLHAWAGVACTFEDPEEGIQTAACKQKDAYSGWGGIAWRP